MSTLSVKIQNQQNDLISIQSLGAKIAVSLGGVSIMGSFTRGDGKEGITHPCTPIFGPDRRNLYGLKQHGDMRNEACEVREVDNSIEISYKIHDEGYPSGMEVRQVLSVKNGVFSFEMIHTNAGKKEAAVNAGEHCYFDAPQGFVGTTVNGRDITDLIRNNFDGIAIDLAETNSIKIPGKPEYVLQQKGLRKAVVWVGKNPDTKAIDQTYVCIEPVENDPFGDFFGSPESMIAPGVSRMVRFSVRIA